MLCTWLSTIAGGIAVLCVALKIFLPYFWKDLIYFLRRKRSKATVKKWTKTGICSIIDLFMQTVGKNPHKPFLIYEGTVYTYQDVDRRSNRVAQAFLHYGNLKKGDTVALLMGNAPDFIHVWFGLAKLGFVVAFLNTSIHSRSLLRCINTCAAKALVIGEGATCVLKKKFSARQFWNDCRKYNVTMFLYIGELCRYLCNQPPKEEDRVHQVRIALGNGIRPSVWKEFLMRFGPIKIFEFYGSTEGSLSFLNYSNKIGAVGRVGIFSKFLHSFELLKYDVWKQEVIKDENGRCKKAPIGKPGLLVLQVTEDTPFSGYVGNREASEKKLLRNVFVEGDVYLDTGDLLEMDENGFLYFTDRVGDTFRWKGENVATLEVAEIISMMDFVQEVNVYGVSVKNYEGRIGMAAIVLKRYHTFNGERLYKHVEDFLPSYAKPRFVRIMDVMQITATFKHQKMHLANEGFNPEIISEPLYFMYEPARSYIPLTREIYQKVVSGEIRL
uniref:long-chain-fatty-acid--CoA ligase n=1 Tax=Cyanoderma ruficeps TaxID=181631 RepID=A0A8C3NT76_9PASS